MSGQILNKINFFLGGVILFSLLLLPNLSINSSLPDFQLIDFILPFVLLLLFTQKKQLKWQLIYKLLLVLMFYVFLVIAINGRIYELRDYFELYKLVKFGAVILFFTLIEFKPFFKFWVKPIFVLVVIGNIIHYLELFGLNPILEEYYSGGIHIQLFGLNSLGEPAVKRMVGFAGNPNMNSLVFGFFTVLFFPRKEKLKVQFGWFFIALIMFFLCQSRTNIIALVVILLFLFFWKKSQVKLYPSIVIIVVLSFLISFLISSNSYINLLFDKNIVQNNSVLGRLEVWKILWEMIKEKPVFGHAPFKEYFYERSMYAENEYILQTWRYGFIGLFIFVGTIFSPMYKALKNKYSLSSLQLILMSLFVMVNSLANTPFTSPTINLLFAIIIGFYFGSLKLEPTK